MIEVKSKFNSDITKPLLRLQIRNFKWVFVAFPLLLILSGVGGIVDPDPDLGFGIFLIAFGVLFLPLVYLLSKLMQKIMNKSMKIMSEETFNYFRFEQDKFYQEIHKAGGFKDSSECGYSMLYKAYETNSHFFLYVSRMQAHVVPKKDIITGSVQELSNILLNNLGTKFKVLHIK